MILRIAGTCDGAEIVLTRGASGRWETTVPAKANGEYPVELWAEDEAGNRSYFCTLLLSYDITQLCCSIRVVAIGARWSAQDIAAVFGPPKVHVSFALRSVTAAAEIKKADVRIVRCRICGR